MRSQLDVPLGVLEPQIVHRPSGVVSLAAAEEAIELAEAYGLAGGCPLDESQQFTLRVGLGERADGSWAAKTMADFEPRQNGKNDTCNARELAGLVLFGEHLIIHTAHEFSTANESFLRLVSVFENWDDLRKRVGHIYYANGAQSIELLTGQRLLYKARTGGAGRGFAGADLVVYDEAQHLNREHIAASGPTKLVNPNSQSWYMGSGGLATSVQAWRLRRRALEGKGGAFGYVEHTAETLRLDGRRIVSEAPPDLLDRKVWAIANPAYGRRISDENLLDLYDDLGPELFGRECACIWDPEPDEESVFPLDDWRQCEDPDVERGKAAYAIEVDQDGYAASIAASDGRFGLVLEWDRGSKWLPSRLAKILTDSPGDVWLHPKGPAAALLPDLEDAGIKWQEITESQLSAACSGLYAAVVEDHSFRHKGQQVLDIALRQATRRPHSNSWVWDRRRPNVSVSPLVAVTIARWAALQMVSVTPGFVDLADFLDDDD